MISQLIYLTATCLIGYNGPSDVIRGPGHIARFMSESVRIEARAYSDIHLVQVVHGGERPDIGKVVWDVKSRRCILQQGE
jgi:hypothetical protein